MRTMSHRQYLFFEEKPSVLLGGVNPIEAKYAPSILYCCGDKDLLKTTRVSVIGTRNPSSTGEQNAQLITEFLVRHKITVVSGLAQGIDTVAHTRTLRAQGKTIAVLGTPLDVFYPKQNTALQQQIMEHHLVVSQFAQGTGIQKMNFPMRNRTMALLSHASIIVEAKKGSGTIHQAWEALRLGRPLFIIADVHLKENKDWVDQLVDYGAIVLTMDELDAVLEHVPVTPYAAL